VNGLYFKKRKVVQKDLHVTIQLAFSRPIRFTKLVGTDQSRLFKKNCCGNFHYLLTNCYRAIENLKKTKNLIQISFSLQW
jgi:hypothetical protein